MAKSFIHHTADVSKNAKIGGNTKIWHQCHVREKALIGRNCVLGKNTYIDHDVKIGDNVKIQNNCSIYFYSRIEDGVFIGPHVCMTNDKLPRAIAESGAKKTAKDWDVGDIVIKKGASIGAGSIILPIITIGQFAMIGAGSVVTRDVPEYRMAYGNPAKIIGYVCKCGSRITKFEEKEGTIILYCQKCKNKIVAKS